MARDPPFYSVIDGSRARRFGILFSLYLAFFAIMVGLCFGSFIAYRNEGRRSRDSVASFNAEVSDDGELLPKGGDAVDLTMRIAVLDFDPIRGTMKLNTKIIRRRNPGKPAVNGTLLLGSFKSVPFSSKAATVDQDTSTLVEGDANLYPFDTFSTDLPFAATKDDVMVNADAEGLNWAAYAYAQMQNYRFTFSFDKDPDSSIVLLTVSVQRPPTTKVFSMFIITLMWLLTIATVTITFQVFLRDRDVAPNLLSAQASLLFAMPTIRNTQPAVPPIGTMLDTLSLFWNMTLISSCAIYTMFKYVGQAKEPARPPPYSKT